MVRKMVLILALAALFAPALASAAEPAGTPVLAPVPAPAPAPAPSVTLPDLGAVLSAGACAPLPSAFSLPGCPRPCTISQNCRYYPEEVCVNGCCAF